MRNRARAVLALALLAAVAPDATTAWAQAVPAGPSVQQYTGYTRWPAVAYDSEYGVYLVVWGNGTIRGLFVNEDGTAAGPVFQISDPGVDAQTPRLAYSPDIAQFLVVWHSGDGVTNNPDGTRVRGRLVDFASGGPVGTTQVYSNGSYTTRWEVGPGIAYSTASQAFLVAYNIYAATGAEIGARLVDVSAAGVGDEIAVTASTGDYDREPAVGYFPTTDSFAVAWSGSGPSADFVRARLYAAADGTPAGASVTVAQGTYTYVPDLAYNYSTGEMLLAWIQTDPATSAFRPFGNFLDDAGTVTGTTRRLSATVGAYDANSVAYNPPAMTFFLVTHGSTEQDVGFEIGGDGTPVSEASVITSVTADKLTGSFNPRLAASAHAPGWLVATAASFSSLWTQLITGTDLGGSIGPVVPKLTVTPAPTGGTVTGGGLTCGTAGTTCQVVYAEPTTVTLTATPNEGFAFTGWGGSCSGTSATATVEVSSAKVCRATFVQMWMGPATQPVGCPAGPAVVYPAAPGPIGASVRQYSGATQYPDVAYNACQQLYLTVWSLGGTIRGQFIGENGVAVGGTFYVSSGQFAQTPAVVYNANLGNFLVSWHSSASDTRTELRSAIVTYPPGPASEGTVQSAPTYSTRWITKPAVAYATGSGRYLVGWSRYASTGAEISARMLDTMGQPTAAEIAVTASVDEYDREPALGYFPGPNRFLLVWDGSVDNSADFVRSQLYDAATGTPWGAPVALGRATFTYVPEAALNSESGQMLVAWMQTDPVGGAWRPFGRFVDGSGTPATPSSIRLSAAAGAYDANSVAYNALSRSFFLVTHGTNTLQDVGFEIAGDGTPLGEAAIVTSVSQTNLIGTYNPRLAASTWQPRWLIGTSGSFNSLWTQLVGGRNPGYSITISPAPTGGMVTGGTIACGTGGTACQQLFESATTVSLTAAPDAGYTFSGWGGACSGTIATTTVQVDGARICTATFAEDGTATPVVTVAASDPTAMEAPLDPGAFTVNRTGSTAAALTVQWAVTGTATQAGGDLLALPTTVTLAAGAASATVVVTPVADAVAEPPETVIATLATGTGYVVGTLNTATVTITDGATYSLAVTRPTGGTVTGTGVACGTGGADCAETYTAATSVTLAATADSGYTFTGWGGSCTGTSATTTVLVDGVETCTATFTAAASSYALTVTRPTNGTVSGGGLTCGTGGTTCSASYTAYTSVTLTAAADSGYAFTGWGGSCTGTSLSTTVLMNAAKTCTAGFAVGPPTGPPYTMTISPTPAGGSVTGAGLNCGAGGSACSVTMPAPMTLGLQATPVTGYTFTGWTGDCTGTSTSLAVSLTGARTCGATFTASGGATYSLAVTRPTGGTVAGTGITCGTGGTDCAETYTAATSVTLAATADSGYTFAGWGGSCTGTSATTTVLVDGVETCTATFTAAASTYALTVTRPTNGTVTGGGLTCGTGGTTCTASYTAYTSVTLTAAADSGYAFTGWGGACTGTTPSTTVLMNVAKTCTATFTAGLPTGPPYTLTVSPRPAGGTVTGAGLNCGVGGSLCAVTMPAPMTLGLQATPATGYTFTGWTGDCTGTSTSLAVSLTGARTCGATFTASGGATYSLAVTRPTGGTVAGTGVTCGTGGTDCAETYTAATSVTLAATADSGYTFTGWGGSCTGTSATTTVLVDGVETCTAAFTEAASTYALTVAPVPSNGTVSGGGLTCGTGGTTCTASYTAYTSVTLTAAAATGYAFTGWGGSCTGTSLSTTVLMNAAKTCTASFAEGLPTGPPYTMTISPKPTGGSVTGAGLNCGVGGSLCAVTMPAPMTLGLQATPAAGFVFTNWSGDCSGTVSSIFVPLTGARTCTAVFVPAGGGAP